jgi:hypothetical protein
MKTTYPTFTATTTAGWGLLAAAALFPACAQDDDITIDRNRIWVSARFAFNLSAQFETLNAPLLTRASLSEPANTDSTPSGFDWSSAHRFDVPTDTSAVGLHAGGAVPPPTYSTDVDAGLQAGFEVVYGRALGFFNLSEKRQAAWGVLGGFGTLDINIDTEDHLSGTSSGSNATWTQYSRLDTLALGFKLGPFVELPLGRGFSVNLSAGLAVVDVLSEFDYRDTLTSDATGDQLDEVKGGADESEWLMGFFGQATVAYALNYNLSVFAGVQYNYLGDTSVAGAGHEATLDMGQVLEAQVGLRASF